MATEGPDRYRLTIFFLGGNQVTLSTDAEGMAHAAEQLDLGNAAPGRGDIDTMTCLISGRQFSFNWKNVVCVASGRLQVIE